MKTITINAIEKVFGLIVEKLKQEGEETIGIEDDLYRIITADKWASFEDNEIVIGSLYDDIDALAKLVEDTDRIITYVDFDRMASLLHAISQKNNPV